MHIAVVPHSQPSIGGVFQYSLAVLDALSEMSQAAEGNRYTLLLRSRRERLDLARYVNRFVLARLPLSPREQLVEAVKASVGEGWLRHAIKRSMHRLDSASGNDPDRVRNNGAVHRFLKRCGVDWTLYTTPSAQSFEAGSPYVMPVFDLQHRLQPEFPEVSAYGEWEQREYLYRNGTRRAMLILADSEVGREDILNCYGSYGVTSDRVKVLPYRPAPYLTPGVSLQERERVRSLYRLPERYLFYPAHFWPHKNHVRIVQALGQLKAIKKANVHVVLCGVASGVIRTRALRQAMCEAHRLKIEQQIHYLGYVPNDDMSALYAEATGLVMPTFFGPTNIPIVEAWLFGCPVLTSDIRGIREQVGDAGLLVDPRSVEALADGMRRLWEEDTFRTALAQRGTQRMAAYSRQHFCSNLAAIVAEADLLVREQTTPGTCMGRSRSRAGPCAMVST
jgi:glycosyltransferase involved in cell wall biosynthesis